MSGISFSGLPAKVRDLIAHFLMNGDHFSAKKIIQSYSDDSIQSAHALSSSSSKKRAKRKQVFIVSKIFDDYLAELEKIINKCKYHVTLFLDNLTEAHQQLVSLPPALIVVDLRSCDIGMAQWLLLIKQHQAELKILMLPPINEAISINAPCRKAVLTADYILFNTPNDNMLESRLKQILLIK